MLSQCQPEALPTIIPTTQPECGDFLIPIGSEVRCEQINAATLSVSSSSDTQLTTSLKNAAITLNGTLYHITDAAKIQLVNIRGTVVVSIGEQTHILAPGMMIELMPVNAATFDSVSGIISYNSQSDTTTENNVTPATITPEVILQDDDTCQRRPDWTGDYTVRAGDNLTRIAGRFGITLLSLIQGNCLSDPDRLREGQILRVPSLPTQTPDGIIRASTATPTRAPIAFRADRTTLETDACTTLRWDVFGAAG
ncbi:MAG: LysM peptidoglycan-binding domain-containing protein, partial [Aggregatilineales bacterium]